MFFSEVFAYFFVYRFIKKMNPILLIFIVLPKMCYYRVNFIRLVKQVKKVEILGVSIFMRNQARSLYFFCLSSYRIFAIL